MKSFKTKVLGAGAVLGVGLISAPAFATGVDFATLTTAVDFSTAVTAVMTVFGALALVAVAIKGGKAVLSAIR